MALFAFRDLTLEVLHDCENTFSNLAELLEELSWVKVPCSVTPSLRLSVGLRSNGLRAPPWARELFRADGFSALVSGDDFYLTDSSSLLYLQPGQGRERHLSLLPFLPSARSSKVIFGHSACSNSSDPWDSTASTPQQLSQKEDKAS